MFYQMYEWNHAALRPLRAFADLGRAGLRNPLNHFGQTALGRSMAASFEVFERTTRRYGKPDFDLPTTVVDGESVAVTAEVVWEKPFCRMLHFARALPEGRPADPRVLLVAPMSGHYATLLRGTVEAMLPAHEVYITDWIDARMVPLTSGGFDLDDYVDYIAEMLRHLGPGANIVAVCQPSVPVLAAVSLMEEDGDPCSPATMTLMGGPIDTRISPTAVNKVAHGKGIGWFERNVIMKVPFPHPGFLRDVYPGFLQLGGFMSMNLDRHVTAHKDFYQHLIEGDGDSAEKHRDFYDEYLAVMDLTKEFYLQTIETVFLDHKLPEGTMTHRGRPVRPAAIRNCALLTVEGELDDITGMGQTQAAHTLCRNLAPEKQMDWVQPGVGHYGVFNGSKFRRDIQPRLAAFIRTHARGAVGTA
ncbi:polyhydroxyalkanoate depolymerase [Siculibacillus lacustris]|uniref:Polyhydroxyalkanoate depolymerase n=1 Tax=Siculibacillus lacustris TaxID=1549641 RepID=A0A4Q9VXN5_9HYPH|nr:polyhydroxyalkanoate depolymerase [Siculibacillus lacustris]TBW41252.1 polyhydroxyalkanoate depolymerase [Siculibacillus lacustris]